MARSYFFKVPYGENQSHWLFGKYENKNAVLAANKGAFEVLTVKQAFEKYGEAETRAIARNCLIYQPEVRGEFPDDVSALLK